MLIKYNFLSSDFTLVNDPQYICLMSRAPAFNNGLGYEVQQRPAFLIYLYRMLKQLIFHIKCYYSRHFAVISYCFHLVRLLA